MSRKTAVLLKSDNGMDNEEQDEIKLKKMELLLLKKMLDLEIEMKLVLDGVAFLQKGQVHHLDLFLDPWLSLDLQVIAVARTMCAQPWLASRMQKS